MDGISTTKCSTGTKIEVTIYVFFFRKRTSLFRNIIAQCTYVDLLASRILLKQQHLSGKCSLLLYNNEYTQHSHVRHKKTESLTLN